MIPEIESRTERRRREFESLTERRRREFESFAANAMRVRTRPVLWLAKRIAVVQCLNPRQKISYHYERAHEMTFEDGTTLIRNEDHWRRPGVQMKAGNYVLVQHESCLEVYCTPEELAAGYIITKP